MKSKIDTFGFWLIIVYLTVAVCWVTNLIQFFNCDFEPSYKDEVIHVVGVFIPPASVITVWF